MTNTKANINEDFLHYLWKYKLLLPHKLITTEGEPIEIKKVGFHNFNAGPDFRDARLLIGKTEWIGNVEIHLKSSDWIKHNHHKDKAYDNVILHVVLQNDIEIKNTKGVVIPCLEITSAFNENVYQYYLNLTQSTQKIPCTNQLKSVNPIIKNNWIDRLLVERLEQKSARIETLLVNSNNNWDEVFYKILLRNFGFKKNDIPFELLAQNLPFSVIAKHIDNKVQVEALLLGVAGFLDVLSNDAYVKTLQNEFAFLANKFKLKKVEVSNWHFLRMRPANFPTIRLAQLAELLFTAKHLFSNLLIETDFEKAKKQFLVNVSPFWNTHYLIDKESDFKSKKIGIDAVDNIFINTVCPMLFVYGQYKQNEDLMQKAQDWLQKIQPEKNSIIKNWETIGEKAKNAHHSQALLQLFNNYCSSKKCLSCAIGLEILK